MRAGTRRFKESLLKLGIYGSSALTCLLLLTLLGIIFYKGFGAITLEFLTSQTSYIADTIGIMPNILYTFYIVFLTMLIATPIGVGAAIYLTEYANRPRLVSLITFSVETLTGIPSIIFGLVGMLFFTQILGLRQGLLAGGLTLVILVLPTIITNTREALLTVPDAYRHGALALGSGKWHMIRTIILPQALNGILTGCILGTGRIVGESAALLFTAGFGLKLLSFGEALQSSAATLTVALYIYANEQGKFEVAFGIAAVLLLITLTLNVIASVFTNRLKEKSSS
ncbi:phosphate ABC transporter permease PstA [Atopobium deltae]|uniref:Phosphate transport system permease protein PstA n=1 Tax=Atopobium deltae TaxID=1393034 RepID=A0A133XWQ5_9ACTN|nr:phosphate ABC transporter permease PstA [Atopobium deltae]KXB35376.1 phosphate ABC transporter, permease protein PstA [Atopobium deltae]